MTRPFEVVCVGDADVDIYLDVDHIPERDEKILARGMEWHSGGMVANFAAALSQLGTSCGFHGPIGDDDFGRFTISDLAAHGVDVSGVYIKPNARTYFCVVMLDTSGEKSLIVAATDAIFPLPHELNISFITQAKHVHSQVQRMDTALRIGEAAREHGLTLSLDLEPTAAGSSAELKKLLRLVNVLFVNERALRSLGMSDLPIAKGASELVNWGPDIVCVTRGAAGSVIASAEGTWPVPAFRVPVIDSTGAGDCFGAGFIHCYLRGSSLPEAARFASAVAAIKIQARGGHGRTPTESEVEQFVRQHASDA